MNFYQYIFLENLPINNDLTIRINDSIKEGLNFNLLGSSNLGDNYIKNPYMDSYGLTTNVVSRGNHNYFGDTTSNEFGLFQECLYTLEYDMLGKKSNISMDYYERMYSNDPVETVVIDEQSSELSNQVTHCTVTFKVPTSVTSGVLHFDATDCIYDNLVLIAGIPNVINKERPVMTISRLGESYLQYLNSLNGEDIDFELPNNDNMIAKIRSLSLISKNTPEFVLAQLCSAELLALNYYQENDQSMFNLLLPSDFYRIKRNLKALKYMVLKDAEVANAIYDDIDTLIKALGYYQTAFETSTESISNYLGR